MDYLPTRLASRVLPCRNSGSLLGARATPDRCDARHRTSLAPNSTSGRRSCGANPHRFHTLFFLASVQCQHAHPGIAEDCVNLTCRKESRESVGISKLTSSRQFRHHSNVTGFPNYRNSYFTRQQGLESTFLFRIHPHDYLKSLFFWYRDSNGVMALV